MRRSLLWARVAWWAMLVSLVELVIAASALGHRRAAGFVVGAGLGIVLFLAQSLVLAPPLLQPVPATLQPQTIMPERIVPGPAVCPIPVAISINDAPPPAGEPSRPTPLPAGPVDSCLIATPVDDQRGLAPYVLSPAPYVEATLRR